MQPLMFRSHGHRGSCIALHLRPLDAGREPKALTPEPQVIPDSPEAVHPQAQISLSGPRAGKPFSWKLLPRAGKERKGKKKQGMAGQASALRL